MLVTELFARTRCEFPAKQALIAPDGIWDFETLDRDSDAIARHLQSQGVERGDRVVGLLENSGAFVVIMLGVMKAGAVFIPVSPTIKAEKLALILNDCDVCAMFGDGRLAKMAQPAFVEASSLRLLVWNGCTPALDGRAQTTLTEILAGTGTGAGTGGKPRDAGLIDQDLALIIYTSGSTGLPKGVMLTHANICNTTWAISQYLGNQPDDVILCTLPLAFNYGLSQILTAFRVGYQVVIEKPAAFPGQLLSLMVQHRVTGLPGVPSLFALLLRHAPFEGLDLSRLRYITNAAAALPPAHIGRLRQALPHVAIFCMYGQTECTRVSWLDPARLDDKMGSVGKAIPNSEIFIVDEDGQILGPHQIGELVVRGANVMRGYWGKPQATAERLRDGIIQGEKVLYSGDLFWADEEGFLYFVGRKDEIFKCRGEKVSPMEIEQVLYEIEAVAEAVVVGLPDEIDGIAIKAIIVPRMAELSLDEAAIRRHCRARLEPHLVPRFVEIASCLPKTATGKIMRRALTESLPSGHSALEHQPCAE